MGKVEDEFGLTIWGVMVQSGLSETVRTGDGEDFTLVLIVKMLV